jgi:NADH-quinone oxidoreductase subunit N
MTPFKQGLTIPGVSLAAIAPEVILSGGALLVLIVGAGLKRQRPHVLAAVSVVFLAGAAVAAALGGGEQRFAFDSAIALDGFSTFFKIVLALIAIVAVLASSSFLDSERAPATEYFGLLMLGTAGMMLMTAASDLITIFLALETFSLALYVLAAFRRSRLDSQEGALKYFLTGSFSSAFFLFGVALIYGGIGSTRLSAISRRISAGDVLNEPLLMAGLALLIVGLAFKVAAVPFHMWTPDAYQGSPAPVSGFMAAGSKVAGFAALLRILMAAVPELVTAWRPVIAALAILTMIVGAVVAVVQTNVKRMLAYSSIAHSGFVLTGVAAANERALSGSLFYLAVYTFVILGSFAVVYAVGNPGEDRVELKHYRGLWSSRPFLAGALALLLISLAGVPPTAGFWAKFEVFAAAADAGLYPLVVIGVITSAIAAIFYLRVIVQMFLEEAPEWVGQPVGTLVSTGTALLICSAVVVILGVFPAPLLDFARSATLLTR